SWDEEQNQAIIIQHMEGKVLHKVQMGSEGVITSLDWQNENEIVYVFKDESDEKSVLKLNLLSGSKDVLVEASPVNIGAVVSTGEELFIESSSSGVDNIFHLTANKELKQLTSSLYGAYAPALHQDELIYNDYSPEGMN